MTRTDIPVDLAAVAAWMDERSLGSGPLEHVQPIHGGTQNVMLRFTRDGREYVLRRGPVHLRPRSNDVMRREMRVLQALADTPVPHPRLIAACPDEGVLGDAVFYLMEPVDGFNAGIELPALHAENAQVRHQMGRELVDALATLGAVDHEAVGLGDFGKPAGFLERQVPRWLSELESYAKLDGYPGPQIPGVQQVGAWLDEHRPAHWSPGILHGDYHAGNVMFSRTGPQVVAIVDWEMCTIGDPLLDLGWLLATWQLPGRPDEFASRLNQAGGLPSAAELTARYAERSTRDLSAITWYTVLACFKLGIVLEGSYARALAGKAPMEIGQMLHATTLALFERAHNLIEPCWRPRDRLRDPRRPGQAGHRGRDHLDRVCDGRSGHFGRPNGHSPGEGDPGGSWVPLRREERARQVSARRAGRARCSVRRWAWCGTGRSA